MYWSLTLCYCATAVVTLLMTFFQIPWWTVTHARWLLAAAVLALLAFIVWTP